MDDYLERAVIHLGVDRADVIKHRVEGTDYIVVVNKGIEGCPKYHIPLFLLEAEQKPKPKPIKIVNPMYDSYSYRDVQALAIAANIPANQKRDVLIAALEALEEEE